MKLSGAACLTLAVAISAPNAAAQGNPSTEFSRPTEQEILFAQPVAAAQAAPPPTLTLQDALDRARKIDAQFLGASFDVKIAHEDRVQARNAMLPTVTESSQYLGTQGNGGIISDGRFVTNDGVHVYRAWGVYHQDLSPGLLMGTAYNRARAGEALANAKAEIVKRGLTVTVMKAFYALIVAQRKYSTLQQAMGQAGEFLRLAQELERQGQSAHSDSLKAEIQYRVQQQSFDEIKLSMEDARLNLAVLLFPAFNENFSVVDDLDSAQALPPFSDVQTMAGKENPELRAAIELGRQADLDVKAAKSAFLPTIVVDTDYGIEANCFALRCSRASFPEAGVVPNLSYFLTAALTVPVWDWGTMRSKLHQAEYKQQESKAQLSDTQRRLVGELYSTYNEAAVARSSIERSRLTAELATESLRLTNLRYTGGASPAAEVVEAENVLVQARNSYVDAQARYRIAIASLQALTGNF